MGYRNRHCAILLLLMTITAAIIVYSIHSDGRLLRPNHSVVHTDKISLKDKEVFTKGGIMDENWDKEELDKKEDLNKEDLDDDKDLSDNFKSVHNSTSSPSDPTPSMYGYVLNLRYGGQQSGGAGSMASLQCWIKSFNLPMLIVEPAIWRSKFRAADNPTLKLGDIFDLQKFNNLHVGKKRYGKIATWGRFLENAPREIVYVRIFDSKDEKQHSQPSWKTTVTSLEKPECKMPKELHFLEKYKFCITRYVDFQVQDQNPFTKKGIYSPFPPNKILKLLFQEFQPQEVTLIIDHWLPMYCVPNPQLEQPEVCQKVHYMGRRLIYASPHLLKRVEQYEKLYLQPRTSVAVMLRSEHLINWEATQSGIKKLNQTIQEHLNFLVEAAKDLQRQHPEGKIFVTLDAGKYGSGSWKPMFARLGYDKMPEMLQALKDTVTTLTENVFSFDEWEDSFTKVTGNITDRGYIAALQRTIGSRADCLILAGGGTFGLGAISEYVHYHPQPKEHCYKFLAMAPGYRHLYKVAVTNLTATETTIQR